MLTGKNTLLALITGSTSGIGLSLARQLLAGGRRVIGLKGGAAPPRYPNTNALPVAVADCSAATA